MNWKNGKTKGCYITLCTVDYISKWRLTSNLEWGHTTDHTSGDIHFLGVIQTVGVKPLLPLPVTCWLGGREMSDCKGGLELNLSTKIYILLFSTDHYLASDCACSKVGNTALSKTSWIGSESAGPPTSIHPLSFWSKPQTDGLNRLVSTHLDHITLHPFSHGIWWGLLEVSVSYSYRLMCVLTSKTCTHISNCKRW